MPHGQTVQHLTAGLPPGQESIQQRNEARVVRGFQQVDQLVDHDVFEALDRKSVV